METSLTGKALDFGSNEYGFDPRVSSMRYNSYAYVVNHLNLAISRKKLRIKLKYTRKTHQLVKTLFTIGYISNYIVITEGSNSSNITDNFNKKTFGNLENDPRLKAKSVKIKDQSSFLKKGVFTSCSKDNNCPPWSMYAEEIEHESWFLELIYGRPSGHMRRKYSGERPHTGKHSRALDMA
mgnify:CR=1 FL=1